MNTRYTGMILKIAWRNVWRNKTRSLVVVIAVGLGLWAGIFTAAFMYGISGQRLNNIIRSQISHIQIHAPGFTDDLETKLLLNNQQKTFDVVKDDPRVKGVTGRIVATGMISSTVAGTGVVAKGIDPDEEKTVTDIHQKLIEGSFFEEEGRNQILVGQKLADRLHAKMKTKVVMKLQDADGNFVDAAFRVAGIFKTNSAKFDESTVFVRRTDLAKLLGTDTSLHEMGILLHDAEEVDSMKSFLQQKLTDNSVESWKDLAPELNYINNIMDEYLRIFMIIILLAMAFGIINTMLMAVLERIRELGMLMAVGMNKIRVFLMIMLETVFLSLTGVPVGIFLSLTSISYFSKKGVDLSLFSKGLANFDIETIVYPTLETSFYPMLIGMVIVTAILSALYPAFKALSLKPAAAIRTI